MLPAHLNADSLPRLTIMKKAACRTFAALCAIILGACANGNIRSVHAVSVDPSINRPAGLTYTNQASANVDALAPGAGLAPLLVLGAIHGGVIAKPRKEIEAVVASHGIAIERIVPAAFTDEMARSGSFSVVPPGSAEATLKLKMIGYGLAYQGDAARSSGLAPMVFLEVRLIGSDGGNIKTIKFTALASKEHWHTHEQFREQPELLRTGWEHATRAAARTVAANLRMNMKP